MNLIDSNTGFPFRSCRDPEFFRARQAAMPDALMYNCLTAWWIEGPLRPDVLRQALTDLHHRHQALHASYRRDGGSGTPVADPTAGRARPEYQQLGESTNEATAVAEAQAALGTPLDPASGHNWRVVSTRCTDTGRTLLGVAVHHIALDGWSEAVLGEELAACYAARLAGRALEFTAPAATLAALEEERQSALAGVDLDEQCAYWQRQLGRIPELALPVPRVAGPPSVEVRELRLGLGAWATVAATAKARRGSPFTVLLHDAYATALQEATGQEDFGIGTPIVRRGTPAREHALGCFVDMVTMRLPAAPSHADVARTVSDALAHQDVPFSELVRLAGNPPGSRTPLHQTMFALQNNPRSVLELTDCRTAFLHLPRLEAAFELIAEVWPQPDGTALVEVTYRTDRVAAGFVDEVAERFRTVLARPDR